MALSTGRKVQHGTSYLHGTPVRTVRVEEANSLIASAIPYQNRERVQRPRRNTPENNVATRYLRSLLVKRDRLQTQIQSLDNQIDHIRRLAGGYVEN